MHAQNQELLYVFVVAAVVFLILVLLIVIILYLHNLKVKKMNREKEMIKTQLLKSRLEVEEQTKRNIAQELHDNIGALSSLIKINLTLLGSESNTAKKELLIGESKDLIKTLITELKQISISLNSDRLELLTISEMITQDVTRLQKTGLFEVSLYTRGEPIEISNDRKIILYRICQELLHNCLKHSDASVVRVNIHFLSNGIDIQVKDNGKGFSTGNLLVPELDGSGLGNIRSRVKLLNGSFEVESETGSGTCCSVFVPLKN
jgi:signal transduction histidine kinase